MEWVIGGVVCLVIVIAFLAGRSERDDATDREYQWGDELHEYSYRHPWDDD